MSRIYIEDMISRMINHLIKNDQIIGSSANFKSSLQIKISRKSDRAWGGVSRHGDPRVFFGLQGREFREEFYSEIANKYMQGELHRVKKSWHQVYQLAAEGKKVYMEYNHIKKCPEIGAFISNDLIHHQNAVIAHELSHAVQFWNKRRDFKIQNKDYSAHGEIFQNIYRILRKEFVNPHVEPLIGIKREPVNIGIKKEYNRTSPKGAVGMTWELYDNLFLDYGFDLTKNIAVTEAIHKGINSGTATTQFYKWKKNRGY